MKVSDLREFLSELPEEFDSYDLVNGDYGKLSDDEDDDDNLVYRKDSPIHFMVADEQTKEVVFCHQTEEEVNEVWNG